MRYVDEYRNEADAQKFAAGHRAVVTRPWTIMEICGGQTHTLIKSGIDRMLPDAGHAGPRARAARSASRRWS